jgi:hypothetical protein
MSEVYLGKYKVKDRQKWLDWAKKLKIREDEVISTLKNEHVLSESCFISDDGEYVYYFMEAESMDKAKEASKHSTFAIDKEHREIHRLSLEKVEVMKNLFHFENRD